MMNPSPGGANEQSTSNPDPRAPVERFQTEVRFHNASEEIEEDKQVQLGRGLGDRLVGSESEDTTCHSKKCEEDKQELAERVRFLEGQLEAMSSLVEN